MTHPPAHAVHTDSAPKAVGPYAQAVRSGDLLFLSGQIPLDPGTGTMVGGGIEEQTERAIANLAAVLAAAGGSLANVVKTTVFMTDLAEFAKMNAVYAKHFTSEPLPARAAVQVAALPKGARVEIEAVARL
jgi:2-iminobutanoate/2-iminopropanoate deaminase